MDLSRRFYLGVAVALTVSTLAMVQYAHSQRLRAGTLAAISVVPIGDLDRDLAGAIATEVAAAYGLVPRVSTQPLPLPAGSFHTERGQYLASDLRTLVAGQSPPGGVCVLGVTEADLYAPGLNFVFGEADLPGDSAVLSLSRLRPLTPDGISMAHVRERAIKVGIHEVGHLLGLEHCPDERCVMHFANSAAALDSTSRQLCATCRARLR